MATITIEIALKQSVETSSLSDVLFRITLPRSLAHCFANYIPGSLLDYKRTIRSDILKMLSPAPGNGHSHLPIKERPTGGRIARDV